MRPPVGEAAPSSIRLKETLQHISCQSSATALRIDGNKHAACFNADSGVRCQACFAVNGPTSHVRSSQHEPAASGQRKADCNLVAVKQAGSCSRALPCALLGAAASYQRTPAVDEGAATKVRLGLANAEADDVGVPAVAGCLAAHYLGLNNLWGLNMQPVNMG